MASSTPTVGVLTRTLTPSPAPSRILALKTGHAGDHDSHDTLIWIHDHAFDICIIEPGGFVRREGREEPAGRILAAEIMVAPQPSLEVSRDDIKEVFGRSMLVMTLDTGCLVMYGFIKHGSRVRAEIICHEPIIRRTNPLERIGTLLVIDPSSRFVAASSPEGELMLWRTTRPQADHHSGTPEETDTPSCSLKSIGPVIRPDGHVVHMAFTPPATQGGTGSDLLLILTMKSKVYLRQIRLGPSFSDVEMSEPRRIHTSGRLPDLMVPVDVHGHVILAFGTVLVLYDVSNPSGEIIERKLTLPDNVQASEMVYTGWTKDDKAFRQNNLIIYYLSSSDGSVAMLSLDLASSKETGRCDIVLSSISHVPHRLDCGICAFTEPAHGDPALALPGSLADGGYYSIQILVDTESSDGRQHSTLILERYQVLSNWTPNVDIVSSALPRSHDSSPRVGESLFVTSGMHDNGRLVELRPGVECNMLFSLDFETSTNVRDLWIVRPADHDGLSAFLVSDATPTDQVHTTALVHDSGELYSIDNINDASSGFVDISQPTIHMSNWATTRGTLHVTTRAVFAFKGVTKRELFACPSDDVIRKAEVIYSGSSAFLAILTTALMAAQPVYQVHFLTVSEDLTVDIATHELHDLPPAAITVGQSGNTFFLLVVSDDGEIRWMSRDNLQTLATYQLESPAVCEKVSVLNAEGNDQAFLVCAMRDGSLSILSLGYKEEGPTIEAHQTISLGLTPVNIISYKSSRNTPANAVIALCGSRVYLVKHDEHHPRRRFSASPVWITDKDEPDFQLKGVSAISQVDQNLLLDDTNVNGCLAILTGSTLVIASLNEASGMAIPRSLDTRSSPTRLLYSRRLGHFALGGNSKNTHTGESEASIEFTRSNRKSVIKTEDGKQDTCSTLQISGERFYCMTEWVHESKDGKKFAFLLVGTGVEGRDSDTNAPKTGGRVHLLQPKLSHSRISAINTVTSTKFDAPVRSISLYGANGYICSHGTAISYYTYSTLNKKWVLVCAYRLHSPAVHITTSPPYIHLTTSTDSLMTLHLLGPATEADDSNLTPPSFRLRLFTTDHLSALGQHHLTLPSPLPNDPSTLALLTTKTSSLRGLTIPTSPSTTTTTSSSPSAPQGSLPASHPPSVPASTSPPHGPGQAKSPSQTLFSASLPCSIVRLVKHNTSLSPLPRDERNCIIGLTTLGALVGIKLLGPQEWSVLKYVEVLCERGRARGFGARGRMAGGTGGGTGGGEGKGKGEGLVLGFRGLERYDSEGEGAFEIRTGVGWGEVEGMREEMERGVGDGDGGEGRRGGRDGGGDRGVEAGRKEGWEVLGRLERSERWKEGDMHVDGDLVGGLLKDGWVEGRELLMRMLEEERGRDDRVGAFVREHYDEEMALVDHALETIRTSLMAWGFW
ncbi:mono-functional DNA-alkylating methyl methanesulfonate N-term-domain-containing protein [Elsinoe ampelina]|uniref:Mono-functional DNA-alkylating methyl methanesulfonate N-term-domain-containing protein n=1 Tax=Elsinoe ampelina TaxID=302913 RepID=A0A6A6GH77_9PEZI|nr:mono-functional DNA-alkylating methyl methanesulfonate N-term-domain-containing protein [Elsinoe ampelina]